MHYSWQFSSPPASLWWCHRPIRAFLTAFVMSSAFKWFVVQVNRYVIDWCWAKDFLVREDHVHDSWPRPSPPLVPLWCPCKPIRTFLWPSFSFQSFAVQWFWLTWKHSGIMHITPIDQKAFTPRPVAYISTDLAYKLLYWGCKKRSKPTGWDSAPPIN